MGDFTFGVALFATSLLNFSEGLLDVGDFEPEGGGVAGNDGLADHESADVLTVHGERVHCAWDELAPVPGEYGSVERLALGKVGDLDFNVAETVHLFHTFNLSRLVGKSHDSDCEIRWGSFRICA